MILRQMLYRCDTRFLPIAAGFWTTQPAKMNYEDLIRVICSRILDPEIMKKFLASASGAELEHPLRFLLQNGGAVPVETFEKKYGPLRIAGIEKIRREKLWENPISDTEKLWYRGLIFRKNRINEDGFQEVYFLPDDLLAELDQLSGELAPLSDEAEPHLIVRPAMPSETAFVFPLNDDLTDMISLAAGLKRADKPFELPGVVFQEGFAEFTDILLVNSGMFPSGQEADADRIQSFMTENRIAANIDLVRTWLNASAYNELYSIPEKLSVLELPAYDTGLPLAYDAADRYLVVTEQLPFRGEERRLTVSPPVFQRRTCPVPRRGRK